MARCKFPARDQAAAMESTHSGSFKKKLHKFNTLLLNWIDFVQLNPNTKIQNLYLMRPNTTQIYQNNKFQPNNSPYAHATCKAFENTVCFPLGSIARLKARLHITRHESLAQSTYMCICLCRLCLSLTLNSPLTQSIFLLRFRSCNKPTNTLTPRFSLISVTVIMSL